MDVELEALTEQFFGDMRETLDTAETLLLSLESRPDDQEAIQALFRSFHTLKGNAGLVGEMRVQGACHALESRLSEARGGAVGSEMIQGIFEVLDQLRGCADAADCSMIADETDVLARLGSSPDVAHTPQRERSAGPAAVGTAPARTPSPVHAHGRTLAVDLQTYRTVIAAFAPLSRAEAELETCGSTSTRAERSMMLQTMGMAAIDLLDAVPEHARPLRARASYLEAALNLVVMSGIDYDPRRFGLVHRLVADIEQLLRSELLAAPYLVSIAIEDAEEIVRLAEAVDRIGEPSLIAVSIHVPFDTLARTGQSLEQIRRAADHPRHTVFFVLEDEVRATQATKLLSEVLGRYPVVGSSVWGALMHSIAPEE
ncbi:MAG: Hpt domain-containing protein [Spirochaetota bacterium]